MKSVAKRASEKLEKQGVAPGLKGYERVLSGVVELLETARRTSARAVNSVMTATYWEIGRRIVEFEQSGKRRAAYGEQLLERLSDDLSARFGRGFSIRNLRSFRAFYLAWPIRQTVSAESSGGTSFRKTASRKFDLAGLASRFQLPWSHYVLLLKVEKPEARKFYEEEAAAHRRRMVSR